jgi:hypothetical protein
VKTRGTEQWVNGAGRAFPVSMVVIATAAAVVVQSPELITGNSLFAQFNYH